MARENEKIPEEYQQELKDTLGIGYMKRAMDAYSANLYTLRDICWNNKKSPIHHLGYEDPEAIPFYPIGDSSRASTSGTKYNIDKISFGDKKVQYDFTEAYTNIMRAYSLPTNSYLAHVKYDREKIEKRLSGYTGNHPYRDMKTFIFVKIDIKARVKEGTYLGDYGMIADYRDYLDGIWTLTEIELKLIYDFYNILDLVVLDTYTFRCEKNMLAEYFSRIDKLKENKRTLKFYKQMRNLLYGQINKFELSPFDEKFLDYDDPKRNFPIRNRAFGSAVLAIFRDKMARYEQKYVNSEYNLWDIRTDALYFTKEVPEFEKLVPLGIVKKYVGIITEDDFKKTNGGASHK